MEERRATVRETVDAGKTRFERADLGALCAGARRFVVSKGKSAVAFDVAPGAALPAAALDVLIGPTGKLRAPALRVGTTWLVGFQAEAWARELGPC